MPFVLFSVARRLGLAGLGPAMFAFIVCVLLAPVSAAFGADFVVANVNGSGAGSLRQAILNANAAINSGAPDTISFAIPGSGLHTISPTAPLPAISDRVVIDGSTQPGFSGAPLIELDGSSAGTGNGLTGNGLTVNAGGSTLRSLIINRFNGNGLLLQINGGNLVENCFIGTDAGGILDRGNALSGVLIYSADNTIGGLAAGAANRIAFNGDDGITVASGTGNLLRGNSILNNNGLGINLVGGTEDASGSTANDLADADVGPNNLQNFPVVSVANASGTISGTISGVPNRTLTLDLYSNTTADASGFGEGETYVSSTNVTLSSSGPGGQGRATFSFNVPSGSIGQVFSVTATDLSTRDTSEFSQTVRAASGSVLVRNTDDSGAGSLRDAIVFANANRGTTIVFDLPRNAPGFDAATGAFVIRPLSPLPAIRAAGTLIDGATQTAKSDTNPTGPEIVLNGALAGTSHGLIITGFDCIVQSLVVNGFSGSGILLSATQGGRVAGCYLGTDATGTLAVPNSIGLQMVSGARDSLIGGETIGARNLISGNRSHGIALGSSNIGPVRRHRIVGCFIGTDRSGTARLGNGGNGIFIGARTRDNLVGGSTAGARNLISANALNGILIAGSAVEAIETDPEAGNRVEGNYIGTDVNGTVRLENKQAGVRLDDTSGDVIGGTVAGARNLISGNGTVGVLIGGSLNFNNTVQGNFIGTGATGATRLGNRASGVQISAGARDNFIGGTVAGAGNLIAGNDAAGVLISGGGTNANLVQGNRIGSNVDGTAALGNGGSGISIEGGARGNFIGGAIAGAANLVAGNRLNGLEISGAGTQGNRVQGNDIGFSGSPAILPNGLNGIDINSGAALNIIGGILAGEANRIRANRRNGVRVAGGEGNALRANLIAGNRGLGINLQPAGEPDDTPTPNDAGDGDSGPNALQNFPVIERVAVAGGTTTLSGTLNSAPGRIFALDFFSSAAPNAAGFVQGENYLGSANVKTNAAGNAAFTFSSTAIATLERITITATDVASGNTSELSQSSTPVVAASIVVAPTVLTPREGQNVAFAVRLTRRPTADVTMSLRSTDRSEGTVAPAVLVFTAANFNVPQIVTVSSVDDSIVDGNRNFSIIITPAASADTNYNGLDPADVAVTNRDNDIPVLTLSVRPGSFSEGAGAAAAIGTIRRNTSTAAALTVALKSSDAGEAKVPATIIIPAGAASVTFPIAAVDDALADGPQTVTISARADGFISARDTVTVLDNDAPALTLRITPTTISENGGTSTGTIRRNTPTSAALAVALKSSDASEAKVPATITIPAGAASVTFAIAAVDDALLDGAQNVTITASAPGLVAASAVVAIIDDDVARLTLSVTPQTFAENAGARAARGVVRRNGATSAALTIALSSSDTSAAGVPATIIIPAGATSATFDIAAVDDALVDGPQNVTITASTAGFQPGSAGVTVLDNEAAALTLSIAPATISENGGVATGTITRNTSTAAALTIALSSSDKSEAQVPATITIPAGAASVTFAIAAVDDALLDGAQNVTITASAAGFAAVTATLSVTDDEAPTLSLSITPGVIRENGGAATATIRRTGPTSGALVVNLSSSDTGEARVPASVTITAGATSATFTIAAVDDAVVDGAQIVTISAVAAGFAPSTSNLTVADDDVAAPSPLASWGYNDFGQLGDDTTTDRLAPQPVAGVGALTAIAANGSHTLAVQEGGTVVAWGYNAAGQLGDGTRLNRSRPVAVRELSQVRAVAAGWYHSLALKNDGTVWAWGLNASGQLGDGSTIDRLTPVQVRGLSGVRMIAAGIKWSLALKNDGTVWAWGLNQDGQLGNGGSGDSAVAVRVGALIGVQAIAAGGSHGIALQSSGKVATWGRNIEGQLGDGSRTNRLLPIEVPNVAGVQSISGGYAHTLVVAGGAVLAWGANFFGELGDGTTNDSPLPVAVRGVSDVRTVAAGAGFSLALRNDGVVLAWGYNAFGELGDGTTINRTLRVRTLGLSNVSAIAAGYGHGLALHDTP